jgi:hypothetical protein
MGTTPSTAADDGEEEEAGNGGGALPHEQKRAVALSAGGASTSSDDDDDPHGDNDTSGDGEVRKKKEPLVIASMRCGYADLARTVRLIDFGAASASGGASAGGDHGGRRNDRPPLRLSADLAREVIRFLVVEPVRQGEVEVVKQGPPSLNAHGVFSPPYCRLQPPPDKRVRWMSPPPPFAYMPSLLEGAAGGGYESAQFRLCGAGATCRRLASVSVRVPSAPLPHLGPRTSVLEFELQQRKGGGELSKWTRIGGTSFSVVNRAGWQSFVLPEPAELKDLRMVCLRRNRPPSSSQNYSSDRYNAVRLHDGGEYSENDDDGSERQRGFCLVKFE